MLDSKLMNNCCQKQRCLVPWQIIDYICYLRDKAENPPQKAEVSQKREENINYFSEHKYSI